MSVTPHSEIIFLGLCERAKYLPDLKKWNVLGLGRSVTSHVYPMPLDNFVIGLSVYGPSFKNIYNIEISNQNGERIGTLGLGGDQANTTLMGTQSYNGNGHPILMHRQGWSNIFLPFSPGCAVINEPGCYYFKLVNGHESHDMGDVEFCHLASPPLTPERKTAIQSGPHASEAVTLELGCKHCSSKYRVYTALEKKSDFEHEDWVWYQDVAQTFACDCGQTRLDLQYIKHNFHSYLGQNVTNVANINPISMYEKSGLQGIYSSFSRLLDVDPKEEKLQKFIEKNPVLLHQFPAEKIIPKPPILSSYVADFAVVTSQKELILIEIEKTTTKLMKKNGNRASELTHAFDQVRDWMSVFVEHRTAVLDDLGIKREEVSAIKGVVIAGREQGYDAKKLRSLKMYNEGSISFLTFDDLLFALGSLIKQFESL